MRLFVRALPTSSHTLYVMDGDNIVAEVTTATEDLPTAIIATSQNFNIKEVSIIGNVQYTTRFKELIEEAQMNNYSNKLEVKLIPCHT